MFQSRSLLGSMDPIEPKVNAELMQNYRLESPVKAGGDIAVTRDANGDLVVFTIGTGNQVYSFTPDPTSETGWSQATVPLQASQIAVGRNPSNNIVILTAGAPFSDFPNDITTCFIEQDHTNGAWGPLTALTINTDLDEVVFVKAKDVDRGPIFISFSHDATDPDDVFDFLHEGIFEIPIVTRFFSFSQDSRYPDGHNAEVFFDAASGRYDIYHFTGSNIFSASFPNVFASPTSATDGFLTVTNPAHAIVTASTAGKNNSDEIFAILDGGLLNYLDQSNPTANTWVSLSPADSNGVQKTFTSVEAALNANGLLDVFAIGTDGFLYHVGQFVDDDGNVVWPTVAIPVTEDKKFTVVRAARNGDGDSFAFGLTTDNLLFRMFKDAETGHFGVEEIEQQIRGQKPTEIRTYTSEITIRDENGVIRPGAKVQVWGENETDAMINGLSVFLDPATPAECLSNSAGLVSIVVETTSLFAPMLRYHTEFMPDGVVAYAEPNWRIRDKLETVSANEVAANLNISLEQASGITPAINRSMGLIPKRNGAHRPAFLVSGEAALSFPNRIDPSLVPDEAWQINFSSDNPEFRVLSLRRAERIIRKVEALPQLPGFLADFGDIVNGVVNNFIDVFTVTVTKVAEGVKAVFEIVLDNIHHVFTKTVEFIEQAFDLVTTIFAKVKKGFEDLFDWLGFVFDWDDILRTHEAIKSGLTEGLNFAGLAANALNQRAQAGIAGIRANLKNNMEQFKQNVLGGDQSNLANFQTRVPADTTLAANAGANIAFSGFMDNANNVTITASARLAASVTGDDPVSQLMAALETAGANFQSNDPNGPFHQALALFGQIAERPEQALQLAFAGLISLVEGVGDFALALAATVVDLLFKAVQALIQFLDTLLNDPWDVPFVSELYSLVTNGSTLTALDLFSLIVAIPATVVFKILRGAAPFPDDQSVNDFKQHFTASLLMQLSGLSPSRRRRRAFANLSSSSLEGLAAFFGAVYLGSFFFYAPIEVVLDAWPPDDPKGDPPKALSQAAIALEFISWGFSAPWILDPSNRSGADCAGDATAFGNVVWCLGWLTPFMDSASYIFGEGLGHPEILRNLNIGSLIIDWMWAIVGFGLVCGEQAKGTFTTAAQSTQAFMGAIPGLFKFLRIKPLFNKGGGFALAALDLIGDEAVAITQLAMMSPKSQSQLPNEVALAV